MQLPNASLLHSRSKDMLQTNPNHRRLVLMHSGIIVLADLLVAALTFWMDNWLSNTTGLGSFGMRSGISTAQTLLSMVYSLAIVFWLFGYLQVALQQARGRTADPQELTTGFRLFIPVLKLHILRYIILFAVVFGCIYGGTLILTVTPLSDKAYELLLPVMEAGGDITAIDPALMLDAMIPMFIGYAVLLLTIGVPVFYRLRMAEYVLLDNPEAGARHAIQQSRRLTKGNCFRLFLLDLHFWWFYLLEAVIGALFCFGMLLPAMGVQIGQTASYFVSFIVYLGLQLALYTWKKSELQTTYALTYESLLNSKDNGQLTMDN